VSEVRLTCSSNTCAKTAWRQRNTSQLQSDPRRTSLERVMSIFMESFDLPAMLKTPSSPGMTPIAR
jgi:hypothetical protein